MGAIVRWFGVFTVSLLGLLAGGGKASAQVCDISFEQMAFGTVRVSDLRASGTVATLTANCSGVANNTVRLCPATNIGTVANTQDPAFALQLNLFQDPGYLVAWTQGLDVVLDGQGNGTATRTLYGRLSQYQQRFKSGTYGGVMQPGFTGSYLPVEPLC